MSAQSRTSPAGRIWFDAGISRTRRSGIDFGGSFGLNALLNNWPHASTLVIPRGASHSQSQSARFGRRLVSGAATLNGLGPCTDAVFSLVRDPVIATCRSWKAPRATAIGQSLTRPPDGPQFVGCSRARGNSSRTTYCWLAGPTAGRRSVRTSGATAESDHWALRRRRPRRCRRRQRGCRPGKPGRLGPHHSDRTLPGMRPAG